MFPQLVKHILTDFGAFIMIIEHSISLFHKTGLNGVQCRNGSETPHFRVEAHALNHSLTFKAEDSKLLSRVWEARLVLVLVERSHAELAPPTLRPGHGDRVADAAVGQPAVVAAVEPRPPGCVEVTRSGQHGIVLLALVPGLLQGELLAEGGGVEDLAFRQRERTHVRSA